MVQARGLSKMFRDPKKGEIWALRDVSFSAEPSKVTGVLGINGAGKTTCLRILATLIGATSGTAEICGYDVAKQSDEVRRCIGFVSGTTALYGRLTGRECLAYFGKLYGLNQQQIKENIDRSVAMFGLEDFVDKLCDRLSTGQKQRISIARSILHDPPVLFFDEPTSGLDVVTAQTVLEFVEGTRSRGRTVLYSTHIMSEAERLCDSLAIIHQGEIKGFGSVDELKQQTGEATLEKAFLAEVGYERQAL